MPKAKEEALGHIHMNAPRYKYFAELDMELRFGRGIAPVSGSNCGNWPPCHAAMRRFVDLHVAPCSLPAKADGSVVLHVAWSMLHAVGSGRRRWLWTLLS
jgi:hypothetical protein